MSNPVNEPNLMDTNQVLDEKESLSRNEKEGMEENRDIVGEGKNKIEHKK